jgi:hypothetical protein
MRPMGLYSILKGNKDLVGTRGGINPKPKTQNPKPKTRNPKPETQNPKPETQNPKPKTRYRNKLEWRSGAGKLARAVICEIDASSHGFEK